MGSYAYLTAGIITARQAELMKNAFWPMLRQGQLYTIPLTLVSFAIGVIIAVLCALFIINKIPVLKQIAGIYIWVFRGTPLLVQLFIHYWVSVILHHPTSGLPCISFLINVGAYSAETIRAAILSINKGQWEAGYSLGMSYQQTFRRIIIPQTATVSIPPLFNTFIGLVKDTSLASTIMIGEMFRKAQEAAASSLEYLWIYIEVALIYLLFCTLLTGLQKWIEKKLRVGK